MLDGVMLIIVTMFAVLGAYFLSDVLTEYVFRKNNAPRAVVVLANGSVEQVWNSVVDARTRIPDSEIIVLCDNEPEIYEAMEPSMRGIYFASIQNLGESVYTSLESHLQDNTKII